RIALAMLRAAVILLLALIISGPQLVRPNERIERDWLLALVDRSASMTIADAGRSDLRADPSGGGGGGGGEGGQREAREAQLRRAIAGRWDLWSMIADDKE